MYRNGRPVRQTIPLNLIIDDRTALVVGGRGTAVAWADMLVSICVAAVWFFRKASADPGGVSQNKTGNNENNKGDNEQ